MPMEYSLSKGCGVTDGVESYIQIKEDEDG